MNRTLKIYLLFFLLVLVAIVFIDTNRPKPINWTPTYSINDKIPFGLYVLDKESKHLFRDNAIEKIDLTPYEFFTANYNYEDSLGGYYKEGTFLCIDKDLKMDEESINELLTYVSYGNKAFISANSYPRYFLDTLKINTATDFSSDHDLKHSLLNKKFGSKEYILNEGANFTYFNKVDTVNTIALGSIVQNDKKELNFIKVKYYNGEFYLHKQPAAFTNFHLLKKNHYEYAENLASYIPKGNLYWYTKEQTEGTISSSPMRYILSQPALKWAWWLFLIGMLLFMIFNAKRKQRIIPILKPLPNTTLDFIKTIGNLYLQEGDYNNIVHKKIIYFLEKIRNTYLIDTTHLDAAFMHKLQVKSGKNMQDIEHVIALIKKYRNNPNNTNEKDLIAITKAIETVLL